MLCIKNINFFYACVTVSSTTPAAAPAFSVFLPVISSSFGSCVLDHPGRAVVLPGIDSRFELAVLDHPLPPPKGGGSGLPDTAGELFLPVSPDFPWGTDCRDRTGSRLSPVLPPRNSDVPTQTSGHGLIPLLWRGQGVVAARNFRLPSPFPPKRMHLRGGPPARSKAASPSPPASPLTPRTPPR